MKHSIFSFLIFQTMVHNLQSWQQKLRQIHYRTSKTIHLAGKKVLQLKQNLSLKLKESSQNKTNLLIVGNILLIYENLFFYFEIEVNILV